MSALRERLIDEVFNLNTIPALAREQWDALALQQGYLRPEQQVQRATTEEIAKVIEELGAHVATCESDAQLTREALLYWLRDRQLACEPNTPADLGCTMVQIYMKLWVDYA